MKLQQEKKIETQDQNVKKMPILELGIRRKTVLLLWILLIGSVSFGIYKNFTAIDQHTIHETEIIKEQIVDTNAVENFVKNFARIYYSWEQSQESIDQRLTGLQNYLTKDLQTLNLDVIRNDIPTSSKVMNVQIWQVKKQGNHQYQVTYSIDQWIAEGEQQKIVQSSYLVGVYMDDEGNLLITKNPTICSQPQKSNFMPKAQETDGSVDIQTTEEISEFLQTFFKLYPTASEKELSYYVKGDALKPIGKNYVFSELINPIYTADGKNVKVSVSVKYLDQETKAQQISQFELKLEKKEGNWMIIK